MATEQSMNLFFISLIWIKILNLFLQQSPKHPFTYTDPG
jgi:hypothetical protein